MGFDEGKAWLHYFRMVFSLFLVMEELAGVSLRRDGGWSLLLVFNARSRPCLDLGWSFAVAKAHFPFRNFRPPNVELTRKN